VPKLGKTKARGYGGKHQELRKAWVRIVGAGEAWCSRCGKWIDPESAWDLDHEDDRNGYRGPAHRACNRATAGRSRHRVSSARGGFPSTKRREPVVDEGPPWRSPSGTPWSRDWDGTGTRVRYIDGEPVSEEGNEPEQGRPS
jgi:hypothetical protein